ncbi:MAG: alkaline phosphatase [Breznakibacter sp.]
MKFLTVIAALFIATGLFAQENYKTNHPVSEYTNVETHKAVAIDNAKRFAAKPKRVIFLIGDGMGVAHLYSGYTANKGNLNVFQMPYVGFSITYSANNYITDSAAGGTALAAGVKTTNGTIGMDANGKPVQSILHLSENKGLATGLVSTSSITHATPASFIAHVASRGSYEDIALDFLQTDIDVFIGGGRKHFEQRADGRNLSEELKKKGYKVAYSLKDVASTNTSRMAVLTADEHNGKSTERGDMLPQATTKAIEVLKNNKKGFFLMVEGSQIDWGGHQNDAAYVVGEMLDFDIAVGKALEFAANDKNTLVIVTADHETGGMSLVGGNIPNGQVKASFNSPDHTAEMVPVFAYGAGAEKFAGVYQNIDIFKKLAELMEVGTTSRKR